jgi:hypothetical protein
MSRFLNDSLHHSATPGIISVFQTPDIQLLPVQDLEPGKHVHHVFSEEMPVEAGICDLLP